jgi:hypothetical protein
MNKSATIVLGVIAVGFVGVAIYFSQKKTTGASASSGRPINALPARSYAINPNYSPQGQPPQATFAPFSGVPVVESILRGYQTNTSGNTDAAGNPVSYDTTDTAQVTQSDTGTSTFFG